MDEDVSCIKKRKKDFYERILYHISKIETPVNFIFIYHINKQKKTNFFAHFLKVFSWCCFVLVIIFLFLLKNTLSAY